MPKEKRRGAGGKVAEVAGEEVGGEKTCIVPP